MFLPRTRRTQKKGRSIRQEEQPIQGSQDTRRIKKCNYRLGFKTDRQRRLYSHSPYSAGGIQKNRDVGVVERHSGVQALEQRQSAGATTQVICEFRNMTEKEGTSMTKSNNSGSPKSHRDYRNLFLLALHVGVVAVSIWVHPISSSPADRALPYAVQG